MKRPTVRRILERLSFVLWILFTIFSISLAGLGLEGIFFACLMLLASSAGAAHVPLSMVCEGSLGICISILWRQVGIDYFHYLSYDGVPLSEEESDAPSRVLQNLIREVENGAGYARNDARAKAKAWLISHASSLEEEDILLAKAHFGYLLPAEWGLA